MSPAWKGTLVLTLGAACGFAILRALPDTQCTLLHAGHDPVVQNGVAFCGVNEQANYYSPAALRFPVSASLRFDSGKGELTLLVEGDRPLLAHEVAVSHTRKVHLHLRQEGGERAYAHVHPEPTDDGRWVFDLPAAFRSAAGGSSVKAFVDFTSSRTRRTMLAECRATLPGAPTALAVEPGLAVRLEADRFRTDEAATIRVRLEGRGARPVVLRPVMGALGHAVVFGDQASNPGYAHMHPTWEGAERDDAPTLTFRLRMPPPGRYDLWIHVDDGVERFLRTEFEVTP